MNRYTLNITDTEQYTKVRNELDDKKIKHVDYKIGTGFHIVLYTNDIFSVSTKFYPYE